MIMRTNRYSEPNVGDVVCYIKDDTREGFGPTKTVAWYTKKDAESRSYDHIIVLAESEYIDTIFEEVFGKII